MMLTDIKHEYGVTPGATSGHSSITSGLRSPTQQQNQGGQPSKQYIVLPRCRPANRAPIRKRRMENTNNNNNKNTMKVKQKFMIKIHVEIFLPTQRNMTETHWF